MVRHQNNFNVLRLLFAVLVLLAHAPELGEGNRRHELLTQLFHTISFGELAVDGFFALSGYLIVQSWQDSPLATTFLRKRVLRIYPGFIVASLFCIFIVGPLAADPAHYFRELPLTGLLMRALTLRGPDVQNVFEGMAYPQLNSAMWTIIREFACYLMVCLVGLSGGFLRRHVWLALTAGCFVLRLWSLHSLPLPFAPLRSVLDDGICRLATFFLAGGCFYLYGNYYRFTPRAALFAGAVVLATMFSKRYCELALATFGAYLLFYFAFTRFRFTDQFSRLPDFSYGIYLYGWPVQMLVWWYLPGHSPLLAFLLALLFVLPLAAASWYGVEKPCLKLKTLRPRLTGRRTDRAR
jgi:peptidoglycan/LPS O-acetylase OafA/YrhL